MPKRRATAVVDETEEVTPRKSSRKAQDNALADPKAAAASPDVDTPSKRKSILRGSPNKNDGVNSTGETPTTLRRVLFSTPAQRSQKENREPEETPTALRNDRSARKKSVQALQKQLVEDGSEDEDAVTNTALAREILDEASSEEESEEEIEVAQTSSATTTPRKRGRPPGKRRERTPSPPPNLPPHEFYFFQNRTGGNKTSSNTLPPQMLLNHEDYFAHIKEYRDPHEKDIKRLRQYHTRAFDQWIFELEEGFNLCLYGYGSKRELVMDFAEHMYVQANKPPKILVVNGYSPGLTIRDILSTIAAAVMSKNTKLPAQPGALLEFILAVLSDKPAACPIQLIIHSLDHVNLRKSAVQGMLACLAAHSSISIIATCDTPNFPLLWDTTLLRQFRWLYHDATTFEPYTSEIDVVEEVNALLGRSSRRLGGKDGVGYVLKSLTENARSLFRILVAEQLVLADAEPHTTAGASEYDLEADDILGTEDEDDAAMHHHTPSRKGRRGRKPKVVKASKPLMRQAEGVEYRTLYHKAVEEFVCSSELNFRELLKEFHDHQMIKSNKDSMGTERLAVPFRRDELESILEELI